MDSVWVALGCFIFLGFTLEAITGFGGTVIALALGALLLPIPVLVPILVPLSLAMGVALVWRHWGHIDRPLLARLVLPAMLTGTAVGYLARNALDATLLRQAFGILIVWCAVHTLWHRFAGGGAVHRPLWRTKAITLSAGVTHGLFASGGPLLVYALSGVALDKARFRMTLITVWLVLDGALFAAFVFDGQMKTAALPALAYLPVVAAGAVLGEWLHHRVSEQHFQLLTSALLLTTGAVLALR